MFVFTKNAFFVGWGVAAKGWDKKGLFFFQSSSFYCYELPYHRRIGLGFSAGGEKRCSMIYIKKFGHVGV